MDYSLRWKRFVIHATSVGKFWLVVGCFTGALWVLMLLSAAAAPDSLAWGPLVAADSALSDSPIGPMYRVLGNIARTDLVGEIGLTLLGGMVMLAAIRGTTVINQRAAIIDAIAYGYHTNFFDRVISHCARNFNDYRILVIAPSFEILDDPDRYFDMARVELASAGFELGRETHDDRFLRNVLFVIRHSDSAKLPVFVDIPTTLRTLRKVIEFEMNSPTGQSADLDEKRIRFDYLTGQFIERTRAYVGPNLDKRVIFLQSADIGEFVENIRQAASAVG